MRRSSAFARITRGTKLVLAFVALPLGAQNVRQQSKDLPAWLAADRELLAKEGYVTPPAGIAKLVLAPRHLNTSLTQLSPDRKSFISERGDGMPSVATFGKPHIFLGGLAVDPTANRARSLTTRVVSGLQLVDATTGKTLAIETPKGATVSSPVWSPDAKQVAYIANLETASHVFVADVATGKSAQLTRTPLLATLVTTIAWTADGDGVFAVLVPDNRHSEPKKPEVASGPQVRLWTDGVKSPQRNLWSLLEEPYDAEMLKYYSTGQLAVIDVKTRAAKKLGAPAMIQSVDASTDGQHVRVTTMQEPFSYMVQYTSFGTVEEIWDASGKVVAALNRRPLREGPDTMQTGAGFGGRGGTIDPAGKRALSWMPRGAGAGMSFVESVTGAATRHDRLVQWMPPFGKNDTKVLYEAAGPIGAYAFSKDAKMAFVTTNVGGEGEIYAVELTSPAQKHTVIRQRNYTASFSGRGRGGGLTRPSANLPDDEAFYNNPGALMLRPSSGNGPQIALVSGDGAVYLEGTQYSRNYEREGPRAFVDKVDIRSGKKTRLFDGPRDATHTIAAVLDDDFQKAVVNRESTRQIPDSYLWDRASGQFTKITNNTDYAPEFTSAIRKRVPVTRADGITFTVDVTLPPNYTAGTRLPGMFWFYPGEFTSQTEISRLERTENVNTFPQQGPRTIEYLITEGYAVVNFRPPTVGEGIRINDNYVSDLVMNLSAVIDELDKQGFIDRSRLGIGGHSYGAFSTMNALAHTPFFKAGIAGDGMYNRTLTPNAFQYETRDFWAAQKTYEEMSPFYYADKLQGAVLMYHGMEDQNVGTSIISSTRMMQALRANGKTASLFLYPFEDHGPATKESNLDQWARWVAWLDIYVKHAGDPKPAATPVVP